MDVRAKYLVYVLALSFLAIFAVAACNDDSYPVELPDGRSVMCVKSGDTGNVSCDWDHAK